MLPNQQGLLRGRWYAIDAMLAAYLCLVLLLTLVGTLLHGPTAAAGRLVVIHTALLVGYFVVQVPTRRLMLRSVAGEDLGGGRWGLVIAGMLLPLLVIPVSFLELGNLMQVLRIVPDISSHPDFVAQAGFYDPDHAGNAGFQLGPYGAATAWDLNLKSADLTLFGVYPPEWIRRFHRPWLSGLMQLGYLFYYIAPVVAAVPLLFQRRWREFRVCSATIGGCLLLTYLLYLLMPATGPRFEGGIEAWLPKEAGWFGAETIYRAIDGAESFRWNAFPSGHVAVSLASLMMAWRFNRRLGLALVMPVLVLCAATVYLGYHYAVDVLGGVACMLVAVTAIPALTRWFESPMWPAQTEEA